MATESKFRIIKSDPDDYSQDVKNIFKILSINESFNIVGSASSRYHKYPGDIDAFEVVIVNDDRESALDYYTYIFQSIAEQLFILKGNVDFLDFKAGTDERFDFVVGSEFKITQKRFLIRKLKRRGEPLSEYEVNVLGDLLNITSTPEERIEIFEQIKDYNLLSNDVMSELEESLEDHEMFKENMRRLKTIRWSIQDILNGAKELVGGISITLRDAISMDATVKIDVSSIVDGKLQAIEVTYWLRYDDKSDKIGQFYNPENYIESLLDDIIKYASPKYYNPLKLVKRVWNLAIFFDCKGILKKMGPYFGSDVAALSQISSDLSLFIEILEKIENPQYEMIFLTLIGIRKRLSNHLEFGNLLRDLLDLTDPFSIFAGNWTKTKNVDRNALMESMNILQYALKPIINDMASELVQSLVKINLSCLNQALILK